MSESARQQAKAQYLAKIPPWLRNKHFDSIRELQDAVTTYARDEVKNIPEAEDIVAWAGAAESKRTAANAKAAFAKLAAALTTVADFADRELELVHRSDTRSEWLSRFAREHQLRELLASPQFHADHSWPDDADTQERLVADYPDLKSRELALIYLSMREFPDSVTEGDPSSLTAAKVIERVAASFDTARSRLKKRSPPTRG